MMEYATAAQGSNAIKPTPELGRIKSAAERIARATNNIDYFLTRFHGPSPETANPGKDPACDSYRNDLESLFNALDRLETAVASLDHIG